MEGLNETMRARGPEWGHRGLIFRGYGLRLMPALAWGACFSPRTPCGLNASGNAVRTALSGLELLLYFQYLISPHGQSGNHLKSSMRNSWLCFLQAALLATRVWEGLGGHGGEQQRGETVLPASACLLPFLRPASQKLLCGTAWVGDPATHRSDAY